MKRKAVGIILTLALCLVLSSPAFALSGDERSDTGPNSGFVGGGGASPMYIRIVNDKNEFVALNFSHTNRLFTDAGQLRDQILMSGVKEANVVGLNSALVMTDGRLIMHKGRTPGFFGRNGLPQGLPEEEYVKADERDRRRIEEGTYIDYTYEVLAADAVSLVSQAIKETLQDSSITYINTKKELCLWTQSGVKVIDTDVQKGMGAYFIKENNTLWKINIDNGAYKNEFIMDNVEWFSIWSTDVSVISEIELTNYTFFAICTDGSLWGWGNTSSGELGVPGFRSMITESGMLHRGGMHCWVEEPVKIIDGVDRLFIESGNKTGGYGNSVNAVLNNGVVVSWGGNFIENDPDVWKHSQRPDKQWMTNAAVIYNSNYTRVPYEIVQYKDGRLTVSEIGGYSSDGSNGHPFPLTADRTVTLDMSLLGYGSSGTTPKPPPVPPAPTMTAMPTASTVLVNGENVAFDAYNISGNNYFKLRDLAFVLSGTEAQFDVGWDGANNAIALTSRKAYTPVGGELQSGGSGNRVAMPTSSRIYLNGNEVYFTAYNIEGNNYFKLRDISEAFDFGVDWDGARNMIVIDTSKGYTPG